ncbi:MAG TPA: phosphoribosylpyrophosphate synthetase [Flavisolibacter sp.]
MFHYATVSEAINDMKKRGYTEDFNLQENCLVCNANNYHPEDFSVKEVYRFEGPTDPADEAVVYGIEGKDGIKGSLVNGYGYSSEPIGEAIMRKLKMEDH